MKIRQMIKKLLRPKNAVFCPGCPSSLELNKEFVFDIKEPNINQQNNSGTTKITTLKSAVQQKKGKKITSLF